MLRRHAVAAEVRAMSQAERAARKRAPRDDLPEQDVPAAVVCALCGDAECPGCANEPTKSGVVAVVAWERPGAPLFGRLWSTARAATLDAERFFESLPDGPLSTALRFAIACELLAAGALISVFAGLFFLLAPAPLKQFALSHAGTVVRLLVLGVPALAALLVLAHAVHGFALDRGARRVAGRGAKPDAGRRALRFGFYAAGWDLLIGPLGAIVLAVKEGARAGVQVFKVAVGLPSRSGRAFLKKTYRLEGTEAQRVLLSSYVVAVGATIVGTIALLGGAVALLFFS